MARINIILQGFVDINLETNENINTEIGYKENQAQSQFKIEDLSFSGIAKSFVLPAVIELPIPIKDVLEDININYDSVDLAHIKGSRVYGLDDVNSDWDLTIVTSDESSYSFKETNINGNEFDIHLYSQSKFQEFLDNQNIREMETLYHPINVRLIENKSFDVEIDTNKLIESVKTESDSLWNRAKNELSSEQATSDYISLKRIFHSFRILIFAEQILDNGSIVDFSAANYLYESIINSKQTDFEYFVLNFSQLRETLKLNLDTFKDDGGLELIEFQL